MRKAIVALIFGMGSLAITAHADSFAFKKYEGGGDWRKSDGTSGTFKSILVCDDSDKVVKIKHSFTINGKTSTVAFSFHKTGDTFYDIKNVKGEDVGSGYCFPMHGVEDGKICHSDINLEDGYVENSVEIHGKTVHAMGSKTTFPKDDKSPSQKTAWKETLTQK